MFSVLFLRVFAGIGGGLLGTSIGLLFLVFFLYANTQASALESSEEFADLAVIAILFTSSFISNLFSVFFLTLVEKEKYSNRLEIMKNAFWLNIVLFVFALPFYLFSSSEEVFLALAGTHLFVSASGTALVAESSAGGRFAVQGIFGVFLVQLLVLFIYLGFNIQFAKETMVTILFLPLLWVLLPVFIFCTELVFRGSEKNNI